MFCLSGEADAFDYAVNESHINKETFENGLTPLHLSALSGNPQQIDKALNLGISLDSVAKLGLNILHCAVISKKPEQLEKVLALDPECKLSPVAEGGRNILHYAAWRGNAEIIDKILELMKVNKEKWNIEIQSTDHQGYNALNYCERHPNKRVRDRLINAGLKEPAPNQEGLSFGKETELKIIDVPQFN